MPNGKVNLQIKILNNTKHKYNITQLEGKGKMTKIQADKKAIAAYEVFNKTQKIISDFDKEIKKLK